MSAGSHTAFEIVRVECYAGYRGEETPRRFFLGDQALDVVEMLDRWLSPDYRYFKCRASDGATYIVRHDERASRWELTFYRDARLAEERPADPAPARPERRGRRRP